MSRLRVLVADDDPIIRLDLRQMLMNLGYEVVAEAGDGEEAVHLARSIRPDVCVLDIRMPERDGISAVRELVSDGISAAILLTAYSDQELVERATEAGAFAYLVKPFKPQDLPPAIEVAVRRFRQEQDLLKEVKELTERLAARRIIEKAKGILMQKRGLTEEEAYQWIRQRSMETRKSMREIAEALLVTEEA
ncbi:MAG: response regulator [Armatimonadetes bacterium]|nr:MAG: response regulator [Armatimonadota bacterium]